MSWEGKCKSSVHLPSSLGILTEAVPLAWQISSFRLSPPLLETSSEPRQEGRAQLQPVHIATVTWKVPAIRLGLRR